MSGWLAVVGIGPGPAHWITPEASSFVADAQDLIGYEPYLSRLSPRADQQVHASDNRVELDRARSALRLASEGRRVAIVSGGDPGVFAMAAAVFEAVEHGEIHWRALDIRVSPGISAMHAAAARLGAPLGHDFCAISLSDNLKPWSVIERRLRAAAEADFVIALYNPASKSRPEQILAAFDVLRSCKAMETLVAFARAIGRPDEQVSLKTLRDSNPSIADMSTLVLVGSSETRIIKRPDAPSFLYTPRRTASA